MGGGKFRSIVLRHNSFGVSLSISFCLRVGLVEKKRPHLLDFGATAVFVACVRNGEDGGC